MVTTGEKAQIGVAEFKGINWLNITDRFWQCVFQVFINFSTIKA